MMYCNVHCRHVLEETLSLHTRILLKAFLNLQIRPIPLFFTRAAMFIYRFCNISFKLFCLLLHLPLHAVALAETLLAIDE
jgi:hypothetical protein